MAGGVRLDGEIGANTPSHEPPPDQLNAEKLEEIKRAATAQRAMMKLRCGHAAWVPDYTDPETTDCWTCDKSRGSSVVGFAKKPEALS